eukprot:TRINITY_DN14227_c0_g1_i2.p1 TRINITY_DN14227_c0_g1~~TRINITY_DN14227_c0_g1_i2.p1  ORF type:complete len:149 (-),score=42.83 TRINITY_DN14227_c0_g1_i2:158-604(-)
MCIRDRFAVRELQPALEADSLSTTHPLNLVNISYRDLSLLFDEVTMRKGACVVRQLTLYLENTEGHSTFQQALRQYLSDNLYGTMSSTEVWSWMEQSTGLPIVHTMQQWAWQVGYPVLYLSTDPHNQHRLLPRQHPSFFLLYLSLIHI